MFATIKNFGTNQVTSVNVNWSANGVTQTPTTYSSTLDTTGGPGTSTAQINLGSYTFAAAPVALKVWTSNPNLTTDTIRNNDTAYATKAPSMGGIYTIDAAGSGVSNFTTFAAAVSALNVNGICAPVTFNVAAGTYTQTTPLTLGNIVGSNYINTITFEGFNPATRILTGSITNSAIVIFNGSKYVTFHNFTVTNTNATAVGIAVNGTANKINIIKCIVNVPVQTGTSLNCYGISVTGTAGGYGTSAITADSIVIDSNIINGGGYGLVMYGASVATTNRNYKIRYNTLNNTNYYGMFIGYNYNAIDIIGNTLNMNGSNYGYFALYFYFNQNPNTTLSHNIIGNKILNFGGYGLYMYSPQSAATSARSKVYNNTIVSSIGSGSGPGYYGVYLYQPNAANILEFYHNTVIMGGSASSTSYTGFYNTGSSATIIKNNIFAVTAGIYTPLYLATVPTGSLVNYNNYYNYTNPTSGNLLYRGGFFTPSNYRTATAGGDSSFNIRPSFISTSPVPGNYHLTDGCNGSGVDLTSSVSTDIDGDIRSTSPNPGSDEFIGGVSDNIMVLSLLTPSVPITLGAQDVKFIVKNIGANTVYSLNSSYKLGSSTPVTQAWSGSLATCSQDTMVFTGSNQVTLGAVNLLKVFTDGPNGNPDADKANDTISNTLYAPLNGIYTVGGTAPDFATPQAAASALSNGVGGPVKFDIRAGTYGQVIVTGPILGTSSTNTVTFEGNSTATRVISTSTANSAAFLITQANWVKVRNLTITNAVTSACAGIAIVGNSSANNNGTGCGFKNCIINLPNVSTYTAYGISITGTAGGMGQTVTACDSVEIDSNIITGNPYYGVSMYGATNAAYNRGIKIRNNTWGSIGYGLYFSYIYNPVDIIYNTINMVNVSGGYAYYGMYMINNTANHATISSNYTGNIVRNYYYYGMYMSNPGGTIGAPVKIYNNIVSSGTLLGYYNLYLQSSGYTQVYHNTLIYKGTGGSNSYTPAYLSGSTNIMVKNNIFGVEGNTGNATALYLGTSPATGNLNYNVYYNKSNSNLVYRNGVFYNPTNLLGVNNGGDTSYNIVPPFVNLTSENYHVNSACFQRGVDLTSLVPNDIDGEIRNVPPQIGADEATSGSLDLSAEALLAPTFPVSAGSQDVVVFVRNNGSTTITTFNVGYKVNGGVAKTQTWLGSLSPCDTVSITFTGTQQISIASGVSYAIKAYTYTPNFSVDGNPTNDTIFSNVATPMSGTYIIGTTSPSDFPSFNAAVVAMQARGIVGNVIFNVRTGTYNESVNVTTITGLTASNTVTFKSLANQRDSVMLSWNSTTGNSYVLALNSSNVSFKNMSISQLSSAGTYYTILIGSTTSDTIDNCKIISADYTSSTTYCIYANGSVTNGLVLRNNAFSGYSYYGIYLYGSSASPHLNTVIEGNTFTNFAYVYLTYFYYANNLKINRNVFNPGAGGGSMYFYHYYNNNGFTFTNNTVNLVRTNNYLYLGYYSQNLAAQRGLIANNVFTSTSTATGGNSYMAYASNYLSYINNTFYSVNPTYGFAYYFNYSCTDLEFKNNAVTNASTGPALNWYSIPTTNKFNYNNYYTAGAALFNISSPVTSYANMNAYKAALGSTVERNSLSYRQGLTALAATPLPSDSASWTLNGRAIHDARVTTDINNNPRPATPVNGVPDIGAFEFNPTSIPPAALASPTTPVAGGTQVFTIGSDTVATITYDAFSTVPSTVAIRQYSGRPAPQIGTATAYPFYYLDVAATTGSTYSYTITEYYKAPWIGTVVGENNLKLAMKIPSVAWSVLTGSASIADTIRRTITNTSSLSNLPAIFTGADDNNPLPVTLISFKGKKADTGVDLYWATASEKNSSHFILERSFDNTKFDALKKVKSSGNSNTLLNYNYADESAFKNGVQVVYYRLKMVDLDGSSAYSNTVVITNEEVKSDLIKVYPNPFNDKVYVELKIATDQMVEIRDLSGRMVYSQIFSAKDFAHELNLPDLDKGIYILIVNSKQVTKMLKQ